VAEIQTMSASTSSWANNVPFHTVIFPGCLIGTRDSGPSFHIQHSEYLNYVSVYPLARRGHG